MSTNQVISSKKNEFICKVKYSNTLPDLPLESKYLSMPNGVSRFTQYSNHSLLKDRKHDIHPPYDLGIPLDLVDMAKWHTPQQSSTITNPIDVEILEDSEESAIKKSNVVSSSSKRPQVTWLRKTEYISSESGRLGSQNIKEETENRATSSRSMEEEVSEINKGFSIISSEPRHPTLPHLHAVKTFPLYPDFARKNETILCMFDTDPSVPQEIRDARDRSLQLSQLEHALLKTTRSEIDPSDRYAVYLLPTTETTEKRRQLDNCHSDLKEDVYDYESTRLYNILLKRELNTKDYIFYFSHDNLLYAPVHSKLQLQKRRSKRRVALEAGDYARMKLRAVKQTRVESPEES